MRIIEVLLVRMRCLFVRYRQGYTIEAFKILILQVNQAPVY